MALKILAFADTRTSLELPDLRPDVVFLLGDIPSKMVSRINKKYDCPKVGILGNHCHPLNFEDTEVQNIHKKVVSIHNYKIAGFEGAPIYKENRTGQHSENEAKEFCSTLDRQSIDIFIAHSNPAYGDMNLDDAHRGFNAFNSVVLNNQANYFFHGHLHDPFQKVINGTNVYSVYPYLFIEIP